MYSAEIVEFDGPTLLTLWEFRIGRHGVDDMNLVCMSLEENFQRLHPKRQSIVAENDLLEQLFG